MSAAEVPDAASVTLPVAWDDITAAAKRIEGAVARTPSALSWTLSRMLGCEVVVKFENFQFTAAFKERGALNRLLLLTDDERSHGVIALSAGNHAQAVAYHAGRLGIDAKIVMPAATPFVKVHRTRQLGAHVVLAGKNLTEAEAEVRRIIDEEGRTYIHPYDDPAVIAGQATCVVELLEDYPGIDTLVVQVGGGGLLSGAAVAARHLNPEIELVGVQAEDYSAMTAHFYGEDFAGSPSGASLAEGIAVPAPGRLTAPILDALVDDIVTVTEEDLEAGINLLLEIEKVVSEGAGAAGIAALAAHPGRFAGRRVGVILSGGNIDPRLLASVVMRGLVRDGRLSRLHIELPDTPGTLGQVATILGDSGANIVEVLHQRTFVDVSARAAACEITVETLDHHHLTQAVAALEANGFVVHRSPPTNH
jgi:threonine dehydratase